MLDLTNMLQKEVLPVTRQTYRQAAQVLGRAFVDEPVSVAVYKNFSHDRRIRALTVDFTAEISVCLRQGYALQISEAGKLIAVAVIYPPGAYPLTARDQWMLLVKSFFGNGFFNIKGWMQWLDEVDRAHPKEPHYYLEYLGVEPEQQGKAFGSTILRHLVNKADEEQVGCYLENANPRNIPFYQRFGFQVISEKEIIGIPSWFMWRPPVRVADTTITGGSASLS
jgi:ribosomal protein S18 acetylase RimI-like enzyme